MLAKSFNAFKPSEELRNLRILEELEKNPRVSQRQLSQSFNMALGLINGCLNRLAQKGWIRVKALDHRRSGYYLTTKGLAEKGKLTLKMIRCTLEQYSELKKIISNRLLEMKREGANRIVFYGVGDEMEVAYVTLQGLNLKLVGIVDDDETFRPQIVLGYELEPVSRVMELKPDGVLITSLTEIDSKKARVKDLLTRRKVCVKDIGVS